MICRIGRRSSAPMEQFSMPALVAMRCNLHLKEKYKRLRAVGKPAKVAIVAVMRNLRRGGAKAGNLRLSFENATSASLG